MNYEILISFLLAAMALTISPGPDNIYVLTQSLVHGKKHGIVTVLGLVSGVLVHTTLVAFGISALLKNSEILFIAIKVLGACYLWYLAFKIFQSNAAINLNTNTISKKSLPSLYKQGFLMNVLNPKVSLFFLAFFPGFLFSNTLSVKLQFYILGGIFMLQAFIMFTMIVLLASKLSVLLQKNKNIGYVFKWGQIIVFIAIGIFILL